jgi:hypothetical protein
MSAGSPKLKKGQVWDVSHSRAIGLDVALKAQYASLASATHMKTVFVVSYGEKKVAGYLPDVLKSLKKKKSSKKRKSRKSRTPSPKRKSPSPKKPSPKKPSPKRPSRGEEKSKAQLEKMKVSDVRGLVVGLGVSLGSKYVKKDTLIEMYLSKTKGKGKESPRRSRSRSPSPRKPSPKKPSPKRRSRSPSKSPKEKLPCSKNGKNKCDPPDLCNVTSGRCVKNKPGKKNPTVEKARKSIGSDFVVDEKLRLFGAKPSVLKYLREFNLIEPVEEKKGKKGRGLGGKGLGGIGLEKRKSPSRSRSPSPKRKSPSPKRRTPSPKPKRKSCAVRPDEDNFMGCADDEWCILPEGDCKKRGSRDDRWVLTTDDGRTMVGTREDIKNMQSQMGGTIEGPGVAGPSSPRSPRRSRSRSPSKSPRRSKSPKKGKKKKHAVDLDILEGLGAEREKEALASTARKSRESSPARRKSPGKGKEKLPSPYEGAGPIGEKTTQAIIAEFRKCIEHEVGNK